MLSIIGLRKQFAIGSNAQRAVEDVSLDIGSDEFVLLSGRSGSGKTTLLNLIGGLELPDEGKIIFDGRDLGEMSDGEISKLRRQKIGFIFQTFNLIPVLTAFENVEYPMIMLGVEKSERRDRVSDILKSVGLGHHQGSKPGELSGGQRQRVAIARALVKRPTLILADEPTANLDLQTSTEVVSLIQDQFKIQKMSVIFCTHDSNLLRGGSRSLEMSDGKIVVDEVRR